MAPFLRSKSSSVAAEEGFVEGTDRPLVGSHASKRTLCSATGVDTPGGSVPVQEEVEIVLDHGNKDVVELHTIPPVGGKKGELFRIPNSLYQKLMPHQKDGLLWLWELHCVEIPGRIVADDMGLGKTLQTATFISGLFFSKIIHMVMIIAPVSILESWSQELSVAGLKGLVHHVCSGSDMKALQIVVKEGGILLTSYEMFTRHHKILESPSRRWDYVVLDEAHRIKNYEAHVTKAMKSIKCIKKILMTGTPIPNNLLDIYALMDFIQPGILGDKDTFDENFMYPIKQGQYSNSAKGDKEEYLKALARCWSTVSPYLLRRNKSVLIETGDLKCKKHDVVIWLRLTKLQVKLYEKLYELHRETTQFRSQEQEISFTLSMLYQCICNDPYLLWKILGDKKGGLQVKRLAGNLLESVDVDRASCHNTRASCKTNFILDLIKQMFNEEQNQPQSITENMQGEGKGKKLKILVFCQQIYMMDRLEEVLNDNDVREKGIIRIDGSVSKKLRDERIKDFGVEDGPSIFLLSAKVGGEGLNLTVATRVIIVDHSWNISDDNQIADRVYRMGQKKDVIIYRVFTCATVEEHLYKTQLIKGRLAEAITEGKVCTSLVKKEGGKVLVLPETFNRSKTYALLKSILGVTLELDSEHLRFLRTHNLVHGITNQTLLADISFEESTSEASVLKKKSGKCTSEIKTVSQPVVSWAGRLRSHVPKNTLSKQQDTSLVVVQRTFPIPANKVGLLYGKDGTTIHRISIQSSTCINVEKNTKDNKNDPNRSVTITGTLEDFVRAKALIMDEIDKGGKKSSIQDCRPCTKDAYVYVPEDKVGLVIGKEGKTVEAFETQSGACIKQVNKENRFRITGTTEEIKVAESLIAGKVSIPRSRHSKQSGGNKASFPQPSGPVGAGGSTGTTGSTSSRVLDGVIRSTRPVMFEGSSVMVQSVGCPPGSYYTTRIAQSVRFPLGSYNTPRIAQSELRPQALVPSPGSLYLCNDEVGQACQSSRSLSLHGSPGYGVQAAPYRGPQPGYGVPAAPYLGPPPGYGVQAAPYRGPPPGYDAQHGPRHGLPAYSFRWPPHQRRPAPHS